MAGMMMMMMLIMIMIMKAPETVRALAADVPGGGALLHPGLYGARHRGVHLRQPQHARVQGRAGNITTSGNVLIDSVSELRHRLLSRRLRLLRG